MKSVVFGSGSFIGRNLVRHLRDKGHEVLAFGSSDLAYVDYETGNLKDIQTPDAVDCVYYLSQSPFYRNPGNRLSHLIQVNTSNPIVLAERSKAQGAKRFVYFSSGSVYKPSFEELTEASPTRRDEWYLFSKITAEEGLKILSRDGFQVHIVRPFSVYGPGQKNMLIANLITSIQESKEIFLESGKTGNGLRLSLTYIDNILEPIAKLGSQGGPDLLNLTSDQAASIEDIARFIGTELSINPRFHMKQTSRAGDFVATPQALEAFCPTTFTTWQNGVRTMLGRRN